MQVFLEPLTPREEAEYLRRYKEGDPCAKDILIERNMRLVAHIAKKYSGEKRDMEEMISIGTIGLIKAVKTFDDTKGIRLGTYAAKCIENELLMHMRQERKKTREVSLYDPIGTNEEGNAISLLDILEQEAKDMTEACHLKEDVKWLYNALPKVLNEREQKIIIERYGLYGGREKTQKELSEQLNISRSYVSRIEKKALSKLHAAYDKKID